MKILSFFVVVILSMVMAQSATPDYKAFRGAGGINISSNPPPGDGTIVIDGSGISAGALPTYALTNNQTTSTRFGSGVDVIGTFSSTLVSATNLAIYGRSNVLLTVNNLGAITNAQRIIFVETNQSHILSNITVGATSGDEIRLGAGIFNIGVQTIKVPVGVTLSGQGPDLTRIVGNGGLATNGPIVSIASTSTVKNLTIEGGKRTSYLQALLGNAVGFAGGLPVTNFLVSNVRLIGESDCFYLTQPNSSGIIENCDFESKYDTMVLLDGTIDSNPTISLLIKNSRIVGDWLGASEPQTVTAKTVRTIYASGVQLRLLNNYIVATNANNSSALFLTITEPTNWVRVVGGTLIAAGTNSGAAINFDSSPEATDIQLTGVGTETASLHSGHLIAVSSNSIFGGPDNIISNSVESGIFGDHSVIRGSSNSFAIGAYITNTSPGSVMFGFHTRAATMSSNGVITVPGGIITSNGSFVGTLTIQAGGALVNEAIGTSPRVAFFDADGVLTNVTSASPSTEYVKADGSVGTPAGAGDVTAASTFGTDNRVIRSDGTGKGVQASGVTLSDADAFSGITSLTSTVLQASSVVASSYTNTSLPTNAIVRVGPGGILTTSIIGSGLTLGADGTLSATGSGTPAGNSGAVQFNQGGSFAGTNDFLFDRTNHILQLNGASGSSTSPRLVLSDSSFATLTGSYAGFTSSGNTLDFGVDGTFYWTIGSSGSLTPKSYANGFVGLPGGGVNINANYTSNRVITLVGGVIYGTNQVYETNIQGNVTISDSGLLSNVRYELRLTNNTSTITWPGAWRWIDSKSLASLGSGPVCQTGSYIISVMKDGNGTNAWMTAGPNLELAVGTAHMAAVTNAGTVTHQVTNFTGTGSIVLSNAPTIASPVFLTNPTGPTPTAGDADTSLATTAFVDTAQINSNATFYLRIHSKDGLGTNTTLYTATVRTNLVLTPESGSGVYLKPAAGSVLITNLVGLIHKSVGAVVELDANAANKFTITNRVTQATTLVFTNTADGQEISVTMLGEASGGAARVITLVPQLGHLVSDLDTFGAALATSSSITLTNGNAVEINWQVRRLNGTNIASKITRQFAF